MKMFKRKKKEKRKINNKSKAEKIIGFIFVGLIIAYFVYGIVVLVKDTVGGLGDLGGLDSSINKLSNKKFDKSCLVYEKNINGEDLASFYAKTGVNGANINIFTSGNFDYAKYSKETISFDENFALSGNELGVFMNNVLQSAEASLVDRILEIKIEPIENKTNFMLKSIAKIDLSILDTISTTSIGEIYLRTESEVSIVGHGLIIHNSSVLVNDLNESENADIISELDTLLSSENYDSDTSNYVSYEIKSFFKEFRKKTNCGISLYSNQIVFSK